MATITKNDLAHGLADKNNCETALASEIVGSVFRLLRECLVEGLVSKSAGSVP